MSIRNITAQPLQPPIGQQRRSEKTVADIQTARPPAVARAIQTAWQPTGKKAPAEALASAVENMNRSLRLSGSALQFTIDKDTGRQVVKLIDSETGEVIRQIPSEQALAISQSIEQMQRGSLLEARA